MFRILQLLKFFITVKGILLGLLIGLIVYGLFAVKNRKKEEKPKADIEIHQIYSTTSDETREPVITTYNRHTSPSRTVVAPQTQVQTRTIIQSPEKSDLVLLDKKLPVILNIYNKIQASNEPEVKKEESLEYKPKPKEPVPPAFAPFGRMLKCELVNAVDSNNRETPLFGLVMESLYWAGQLIIPAGSEVHGIAGSDNVRDRICSGNKWCIVLVSSDGDRPSGMVLNVQGVALDAENLNGDRKDFGLTDGSFGIRGVRLKSNELEEAKVFASTFLGALTAGLQDQVPTGNLLGGTKTNNTVRDASLGGLTAVMNKVADRIEKNIEGSGYFTRCHAGKQFYLYVQQAINPEDWSLGSSLIADENCEANISLENTEGIVEKISSLKNMLNAI